MIFGGFESIGEILAERKKGVRSDLFFEVPSNMGRFVEAIANQQSFGYKGGRGVDITILVAKTRPGLFCSWRKFQLRSDVGWHATVEDLYRCYRIARREL